MNVAKLVAKWKAEDFNSVSLFDSGLLGARQEETNGVLHKFKAEETRSLSGFILENIWLDNRTVIHHSRDNERDTHEHNVNQVDQVMSKFQSNHAKKSAQRQRSPNSSV